MPSSKHRRQRSSRHSRLGTKHCPVLSSSLGTAVAGTILVAGLSDAKRSYGIAMIALGVIGLIGLGATVMLPRADPLLSSDP